MGFEMSNGALIEAPALRLTDAQPINTIAMLIESARRDREYLTSAIACLVLLRAIIDSDPECQRKVDAGLLGEVDYLIEATERK